MLLIIIIVAVAVVFIVHSNSRTSTKAIEDISKYQELTEWQKAQLRRQAASLILTLPCPKCGHILRQGMRFCPKCGQKADWSIYNKATAKKEEDKESQTEEIING